MIDLLNNIVISNIDKFTTIITALLLLVVGTPLISFKGGIPRIGKLITNKQTSVVVIILIFIITLFVLGPLTEIFVNSLIVHFVDYTIPTLIVLAGLAFWEWDKKMRWNYEFYWFPLLIIGLLLFVVEFIWL